jgi:hypothetical protein
MVVEQSVKLEILRFLRGTAGRMREVASNTANSVSAELLRMAQELDQEADDLEIVARQR